MADKLWLGNVGVAGDLGDNANWSPANVPIAGDNIFFENSAVDIAAGFATFAAVHLGEIHFRQSWTGVMDDDYMQAIADEVYIGQHLGGGTPAGSPRLLLDLQTTAGSTGPYVIVDNTSLNSTDANRQAVRLLIDDAEAVVQVRKGRVGIAVGDAAETSVLGELLVAYGADAQVALGEGVTIGGVVKDGGELKMGCGAANVYNRAGDLTIVGEGAISGVLEVTGGEVTPNASGTIARANCYGGITDWSKSPTPRTVTDLHIDPLGGPTVLFDPDVLTITNPIHWSRAARMSVMQPR